MNDTKLQKKFMKLIKNIPTVDVGSDGKVQNWSQLSNMTKEDTLESGIYDDVDFSKSKRKYPALHLYHSRGHHNAPYWI